MTVLLRRGAVTLNLLIPPPFLSHTHKHTDTCFSLPKRTATPSLLSFRRSLPHSTPASKTVTPSPFPSSEKPLLFIPPGVEPDDVNDSMILPFSNIVVGPYAGDARIKDVEFVKSSGRAKDCPKDDRPEFAILGRSNVGKSSLINSLVRKKELALTSKKPGKTQLINHFLVNKSWYLVDLPGYGTVQEALGDPDWNLAVKEEMNALRKNKTWSIVDLPQDKKTVGCKWVFTVKCKADGSVERYKSRLVARGFTQTHGIDYQETFAPVAKINSIRILLSLAVNFNWPLHQFDVKNAFLNGDLHEEVYMALPPGFEDSLGRGKVCRLRKSLYGLKQSPRAWFERFGSVVKRHGFSQSQADHTLFFKHSAEGKIAILIVYVDDIIMTGSDFGEINNLKRKLEAEFDIKDLGKLKYFLGMEFARSKEGIFINQRKYILDLLKETGMTGCRAAETPMDPNVKLKTAVENEVVDRERYQRLVGRLIYLSHTRSDIAFAVSAVSQFMHAPGPHHFEAVFRILRYLKGTPGKGLLFKNRGHVQVEAYTDADWAGDINDRRSTSDYCTFVGGNLVTWRSKKQSVVARSSAEAEFRSVAHGFCEVLWIKQLIEELKVSLYSNSHQSLL